MTWKVADAIAGTPATLSMEGIWIFHCDSADVHAALTRTPGNSVMTMLPSRARCSNGHNVVNSVNTHKNVIWRGFMRTNPPTGSGTIPPSWLPSRKSSTNRHGTKGGGGNISLIGWPMPTIYRRGPTLSKGQTKPGIISVANWRHNNTLTSSVRIPC